MCLDAFELLLFITAGMVVERKPDVRGQCTGARPHPDFLRLSRSIYGEDSSQDVQP